jgi:hypothetical protein
MGVGKTKEYFGWVGDLKAQQRHWHDLGGVLEFTK